MPESIESVGLLLTYQCNLRCPYCYISEKRPKQMELSTAKALLAPLLGEEGPELLVVLAGGEPLTAFETLRAVVEWAESDIWKRKARFFASTNGTLLNEERKQWFSRHRTAVTLALSYDGLPSVQNSCRTPEGNPIDLDFFLNLWPWQKVQMTITEASVPYMAAGVIFLLEKGFPVNANVSYEAAEWSNQSLLEYSRQLGLLTSYYLAHEGKPLIKQFIQPLGAYLKNLEHPPEPVRICGAGDGYFTYDTDGKRYPCHMFSPLVLTKTQQLAPESDVPEGCVPSDPRCAGCPYITQCPTCIGCNFRFRGQKAKRDHTHCCVMRLELRNYLKYLSAWLQRKQELSYGEKIKLHQLVQIARWEREHADLFLIDA